MGLEESLSVQTPSSLEKCSFWKNMMLEYSDSGGIRNTAGLPDLSILESRDGGATSTTVLCSAFQPRIPRISWKWFGGISRSDRVGCMKIQRQIKLRCFRKRQTPEQQTLQKIERNNWPIHPTLASSLTWFAQLSPRRLPTCHRTRATTSLRSGLSAQRPKSEIGHDWTFIVTDIIDNRPRSSDRVETLEQSRSQQFKKLPATEQRIITHENWLLQHVVALRGDLGKSSTWLGLTPLHLCQWRKSNEHQWTKPNYHISNCLQDPIRGENLGSPAGTP